MTAKETAKEIVRNYNQFFTQNYIHDSQIKDMAQIAIDFIIDELNNLSFNHDIELYDEIDYYNEVKREIEKL